MLLLFLLVKWNLYALGTFNLKIMLDESLERAEKKMHLLDKCGISYGLGVSRTPLDSKNGIFALNNQY